MLAIFLGHIRIVLAQLRQFFPTEQQFLCATNEALVYPQFRSDIVRGQANSGFRLLYRNQVNTVAEQICDLFWLTTFLSMNIYILE